MLQPKSTPTQRAIAKAAGVSQGLVSLVLSDTDADVAEATRIRIQETARRMGYSPKKNELRVSTKKGAGPGKRKVLAYIPCTFTRDIPGYETIYDAYGEFYAQFQNQLVEAAYKKGFSLLVRPYGNPTEMTSWLIEWGVDGVIMHFNDQPLGEWISRRYPMVQINRRFVSEADVVMPNQEEVITMTMEHLRKQGHRYIAHVTNSSSDSAIQSRIDAYLKYAKKHGLHLYEEFLSCESAEQMISLFFASSPRPTAIITGDPNALTLQKEAARRGLSLPEDLSVIGIDNISAARFATPALTSVDIQIHEITRTALSLIAERLNEPTRAFQKVEISPKLIVRESVTSAPSHINPQSAIH